MYQVSSGIGTVRDQSSYAAMKLTPNPNEKLNRTQIKSHKNTFQSETFEPTYNFACIDNLNKKFNHGNHSTLCSADEDGLINSRLIPANSSGCIHI